MALTTSPVWADGGGWSGCYQSNSSYRRNGRSQGILMEDMALSRAAQGELGRVRTYVCATRRIEPLEVPISYESWTLRCCAQCSVLAKVTAEHLKEAYLHPERFGRYHKHLYDKVVGSSSVKDKVIIK